MNVRRVRLGYGFFLLISSNVLFHGNLSVAVDHQQDLRVRLDQEGVGRRVQREQIVRQTHDGVRPELRRSEGGEGGRGAWFG